MVRHDLPQLTATVLALGLAWACGAAVQVPPASQPNAAPGGASTSAAAATGPAAGFVPFQPGVRIDWARHEVQVDSHIVLRRGALEFFACFSGKEHESILRIDASAAHIYMALGLVGISPGRPPAWDDKLNDYGAPTGDLIELSCEWESQGRHHDAQAFDWLREIDYARTPLRRPWIFAGSLRLRDGSLAADHSGTGIAVVDFSDSLIALPGEHTSRNAELWLVANTDAIPAEGTHVSLVFRPARLRDYRVRIDFRGDVSVDGRYASLADLADLLKLNRQLDGARVQSIEVAGALAADVRRVQHELRDRGLPEDAVRFSPAPAAGR